MTIEFALEYIPRKMRELGVNDNYFLEFRHLVIPKKEVVLIDAYNEYWIMVKGANDLVVNSSLGDFDMYDKGINEQQYKHQGKITITNKSTNIRHIKFIQIIFKNK